MRPLERELYVATLGSLKREPGEWVDSTGLGIRLTHKVSGVEVWFGNSYSGLSIEAPGWIKVGGVTLASSFFGSLIPWRAKILSAARACCALQEEAKKREAEPKVRQAIAELRGVGSNP